MVKYETKPIAPGFGVAISGLKIASGESDNLIAEIIQLWHDAGGIAVIHDQDLTSEQHIAFSRHFGPLFGDPLEEPLQSTVSRYIHPEYPEIYRVSNKVDNEGMPLGRKGAGTYWHSDVSFRERPAQASLLHGKQIPILGGDTLFADQARAYEALSKNMKVFCSSLFAWHDFEDAARSQYASTVVVEEDMAGGNRSLHPVVRTNPDTGRKSLFINPGFTSHIDGFTSEESESILAFLYGHCVKPEFVYRHTWREKDLVIWDNRSVMHYAVMDYSDDEPRYMERCTVIGERPT
ncbi:MAG: taurine dioxygenase [Magnetovibrio sp.]|nr:taurine dioxygenase [Magnetovibrio sp.]|tara:strand:- start:773 stop:1648 length:876 start_codon:yes stop_codon:yes gene_type:complete